MDQWPKRSHKQDQGELDNSAGAHTHTQSPGNVTIDASRLTSALSSGTNPYSEPIARSTSASVASTASSLNSSSRGGAL